MSWKCTNCGSVGGDYVDVLIDNQGGESFRKFKFSVTYALAVNALCHFRALPSPDTAPWS